VASASRLHRVGRGFESLSAHQLLNWLSLRGDVVGNVELSGIRRKQAEYKGYLMILSRKECRVSVYLSGFSVPIKTLKKPNDMMPSTPKPDRITVDQIGWRVEG